MQGWVWMMRCFCMCFQASSSFLSSFFSVHIFALRSLWSSGPRSIECLSPPLVAISDSWSAVLVQCRSTSYSVHSYLPDRQPLIDLITSLIYYSCYLPCPGGGRAKSGKETLPVCWDLCLACRQRNKPTHNQEVGFFALRLIQPQTCVHRSPQPD